MAADKHHKPLPGLIPIGALDNIFETALDLGVDLSEAFKAHDVTPEMIENGEALCSSKKVADLLLIAAKNTRRPDFAFVLAARQEMTDVSPLTLVLRTAPTLRHSFQKVLEFGHMYAQALTWILDGSKDLERICFSINSHGLSPEQHRIFAEFLLAQCYEFIETMIGETPPLERVLFAYSKADYGAALSRYFRAPVDYNAEVFGFQFLEGSLDKKLVFANKYMYENIQKYLSEPGAQAAAPFDQSVRAVIRSLLPTQTLSIKNVAQAFDCCDRTLQRRLKRECGVTYKELVDDVRFDLVRQFLAQSEMSVTDLSFAVGYSNPTNFTRAFKKVFGCSPLEWRKQNAVSMTT